MQPHTAAKRLTDRSYKSLCFRYHRKMEILEESDAMIPMTASLACRADFVVGRCVQPLIVSDQRRRQERGGTKPPVSIRNSSI